MQCQKLKTYMETGRVIFLPAKHIRPNPAQPRQVFSDEALEELTRSIREHGILQPLSVRRVGSFYELIAGERRLRAGVQAGLTELPCIVMNMDDSESSLAALVENLQRQELDFIEQARGISLLMERFALSQEQAAKRLGKSQSAIANKLRLLRHSAPVLEALREGGLTERHARALLKLSTEEQKLQVIASVVQGSSPESHPAPLLRKKHQMPLFYSSFIIISNSSLSRSFLPCRYSAPNRVSKPVALAYSWGVADLGAAWEWAFLPRRK